VFSLCGGESEKFWDIALPSSLCARVRQPCQVGEAQDIDDAEELCYILKMLTSYAELLRYRPSGHTVEALSVDDVILTFGAEVVKNWQVEFDPSEKLASRCAELIHDAAS